VQKSNTIRRRTCGTGFVQQWTHQPHKIVQTIKVQKQQRRNIQRESRCRYC